MTPRSQQHRIDDLSNDVETLAIMLGELDARSCRDSATAALLRMELAALTTELLATEAIERAQRTSAALT